jgi:DNA-3-methyladenine glycosylase I
VTADAALTASFTGEFAPVPVLKHFCPVVQYRRILSASARGRYTNPNVRVNNLIFMMNGDRAGSGEPMSGKTKKEVQRCAWSGGDPLLRTYHDDEWGVPQHDSRMLWEMLMLEGFQAGLSWLTILRKRDAFREAFSNFDPASVAKYSEKDITRLLANPGIVRSRAKIEATIAGARIYLAMKDAGEDFSRYVWTMAGGKPIRNDTGTVVASTPLSETISAALKKKGFKFVGPVIVYAWMQAVGIVNDHTVNCFRRSAKSSTK